jgi:hypothetical protein
MRSLDFSIRTEKTSRGQLITLSCEEDYMKNLVLLGFLTFVSLGYAKDPVEHESLHEAEGYKVEKAVKEKAAGRTFAGDKAKKDAPEEAPKDEIPTSEDSEVRYWRYSE